MRKSITHTLLLEQSRYWLSTKHLGHVKQWGCFWCSLSLGMWRVQEAAGSHRHPQPLICMKFKVCFHQRYQPRFQFQVCITNPSALYHITPGRKMITKSNSNTDLEFSKSFDLQSRAQLVVGKEPARSNYLPMPNFQNIWEAKSQQQARIQNQGQPCQSAQRMPSPLESLPTTLNDLVGWSSSFGEKQ